MGSSVSGSTEDWSCGEAFEAGDGDADYDLGVLLAGRGDLAGAETAYRRADERGNGIAAYNLGVLLHERGDLAGAETAYRRGDERGNADAAYNLGLLLKGRGDLAGAETAYRRGDERDDAGAAYGLGVLLHERGDLAGAEAAFHRADERGDATAAYGLGVLLHQRGREAEAETAYRKAIDAGYEDGWLTLANLLAKQRGREAEAEAAYRKAIDAGTTDRELKMAAWSKIGDLLARRGDVAGARAAYEVAIPLAAKRVEADLLRYGDTWAGHRLGRLAKEVAEEAAGLGARGATDPCVVRMARFRTAVTRRPWALRLTHSICVVVGRLGSALSSTWRQTRGRPD